MTDFIDCSGSSLAGQLLQKRVEVFEFGVFDDDFAAAVVVFNVHFQA